MVLKITTGCKIIDIYSLIFKTTAWSKNYYYTNLYNM